MMKHSDQLQQPWTLRLRARAKRCRFNFIYSKILPVPTNVRLSIRFDLRPFTLEFESKPESAFSLKRKLSGPKFIQIFSCKRSWLAPKNYWFGKRRRRRRRKKVYLLWVVLLAVVIVIMLRSYFRSTFLWNLLWMTLPSGFLHQFFKEILDGLYRCLGFYSLQQNT